MPDIGTSVVSALEDEFSTLMKTRDSIETKIRDVRFLGELVKFKVCAPSIIFHCLKACLDDFVNINIDVACALLETCGR
jgi:regulator of nonsense transcripts 2